MTYPPLRFLHPLTSLDQSKLATFRRLTTSRLVDSLRPATPHALKARPDGTPLEGHHRLAVLRERGLDIETLPREIVPKTLF